MINLIVGRTGSGKDYLTERLQERGLKVLKSYTTRPRRTENEDTHIFIDPEDVDKYPNKVATTTINGYEYFATEEQVKECDVYVIDPNGLKELAKNVTGTVFNIIHVQAPPEERKFYAVRRVALKDKIKEEEVFKKRDESENEQFSAFEDEMTAYENDLSTLPDNVVSLTPYYNHYDAAETDKFANTIANYTRVFRKLSRIVLEIAQNNEEHSDKVILSDPKNGLIKIMMANGEYSPEIGIEAFTSDLMGKESMCLDFLFHYITTSHRFDDLL